MAKRSARRAFKGNKRAASTKVNEPSLKRHKTSNEPLRGDSQNAVADPAAEPVATLEAVPEVTESEFISGLDMDSKDIAEDPLPMPEDPLDKFARVLAAVGPDDNDGANDLDIEDDLASLSEEEIDLGTQSEVSTKRWPLDESPEALTFSVLNARVSSKGAVINCSDNNSNSDATGDITAVVPELELDDFIDYDSCSSDAESASASPISEDSVRRAPIVDKSLPLYFYRERPEEEIPWLSEVDFKAKDVLAAWSSVAPGIDPCAKASYIRNVVFAAASLNPTSMASGRARQTMAPPAPPTVDF